MQEYKLINTSNINEARKEIDKLFKENLKTIVKAQNEEFNRKIFENKKVNILLGFEFNETTKVKDKLRERNSGLNHVLCKLAKENDIKIGIYLNIDKLNDFELSVYLARLQQNIRLCKKYKVNMVLVDYNGNKHDVQAFLLTLGMSTNMASYAINNSINHNF